MELEQPGAPSTYQLVLPHILFGRSEEHKTILDAWEKTSTTKQIISVTGISGSGKTALVKSIGDRLSRKGVRFAYGKFDQAGRRLPYSALVTALSSVVAWILSREKDEFDRWKTKIDAALKDDASLITDIIPDLVHIIGTPLSAQILSPMAEKNRLEYLFKKFFKALTEPGQPLLVFIDDLQWADSSSMNLIRSICMDNEIDTLLFIGACRTDGCSTGTPWFMLLSELAAKQNNKSQLTHLNLQPLKENDTCEFLAHALHRSVKNVGHLGEIVFNKTGGIPILIREFLLSLEEKKLIVSRRSLWSWNLHKIGEEPVHQNAAVLIAERIGRLEARQLDILLTAACLGNHFDLKTLAFCCGLSLQQTAQVLTKALKNGLLILEREQDIHIDIADASHHSKYLFAHDIIQNELLARKKRRELVKKKGRMGMKLLTCLDSANSPNELLLVVSLLNSAENEFHCLLDLHRFALLNYKSGLETLQRGAYELALDFFKKAIELLDLLVENEVDVITIWDLDFELSLELHQGAAQAAFFLSKYEEMDKYIDSADEHVEEPIRKTALYEIKTSSLYARNRLDEAIRVSLGFVRLLGVNLKEHPGKLDVLFGLAITSFRLRKRCIESLSELQPMKDPKSLAALRVLSCVTLAAFYGRPNLLPLIVFESIHLSLKYGNTESSAFGYAGYGFILSGVMNRLEEANRFGNLALDLLKRYEFKSAEARTKMTVHVFITHWRRRAADVLPGLLDAYRAGLEAGDHQFASICCSSYCSFAFHCGKALPRLYRELTEFAEVIKSLKQDVVLSDINLFRQAVLNLTTRTAAPWLLKGALPHMEQGPLKGLEAGNDFSHFNRNYLSLLLCLIFKRDKEGVAFADEAMKQYETSLSLPESYGFLFYDSLARLSLLADCSWSARRKYLHRINKNLKKLKLWAEKVPVNVQHKYDLVQALLFAYQKQHEKAAQCFYSAVTGAKNNKYLNDQAMAAESAGRFFMSIEDQKAATHYMSMARKVYFKWGAMAKVVHMEQHYPPFLFDEKTDKKKGNQHDGGNHIHLVLEASRAIAKETRLATIMSRLTEQVMEHSAAEKAVILLVENENLRLQASAEKDSDKIEILQDTPFDQEPNTTPTSIINYVMRSHQPLLLADAATSEIFSSDPYIATRPFLSILCMPIFSKNSCKGILYLENSNAQNAFNENQLRMLDILLGQAIVSIENAKLYKDLYIEKEQQQVVRRVADTQRRLIKNISAELAMAEERERRNIADDLHDSVTQNLALSVLDLKKIEMEDLEAEHKNRIGAIQERLGETVEQIRSLTFQLSPKILYDFGLLAALEWLAEDITAKYGLEVSLVNRLASPNGELQLNEITSLTLYRAIRELLINACKHADADLVVVTMACEHDELTVIVTDNGKGFNKTHLPTMKNPGKGFGLVSMQERIEALAGLVYIDIERAQGSKITISIPLRPNRV